MGYDGWFDTAENRDLLAICTRKLIRNIGVGGIIWGLFNIAAGALSIQQGGGLLNAGVVGLGKLEYVFDRGSSERMRDWRTSSDDGQLVSENVQLTQLDVPGRASCLATGPLRPCEEPEYRSGARLTPEMASAENVS